MSDIPRYRPVANDRYGITDDADGKLCEYRDYARLKAEVDELRLENAAFKRTVNQASAHYDNRLTDIARLKAEVERLRKAGDAMYEELGNFGMTWTFREAWNAAKDGKQP